MKGPRDFTSFSVPAIQDGHHALQELARILGETIDFARQGQFAADRAARRR